MAWLALLGWIGWAATVGAWAWSRRLTAPASVPVSPRHPLDTWTAILHDAQGAVVSSRHGRGRRPREITRGHGKAAPTRYVRERTDPDDPSVMHYWERG